MKQIEAKIIGKKLKEESFRLDRNPLQYKKIQREKNITIRTYALLRVIPVKPE